jgi:hypothetical protein
MHASDFAAAAGLFIRVPCGIISNTFKVKIFIFLVAFLSQHLNYFVIIT